MKFLHLADLHFGKSIYGISLIESGDQKVWVERLLEKIDLIRPDAICIAGDVYDRSNPSGEAMLLLNHFFTELEKRSIPVLVVAGNHDSGERLSFGEHFFKKGNIYLSGPVKKEILHITLSGADPEDQVTFWLMPYLFPAIVAQKLENDEIHDYDTAVRQLLAAQPIDSTKKNVLVAHQNVVADGKEIERGGSESMVGGVGQIDYTAFEQFDYVALGHIHSSYSVGRKEVRYAGSPLCYHFDEIRQPKKGPILVTIGEKTDELAEVTTETIEIEPLHPMKRLEGSYEDVKHCVEQETIENAYYQIILTDQRNSPEAVEYLRTVLETKGSHLLEIGSTYEEQMGTDTIRHSANDVAAMSLDALFADFYQTRKNGAGITEEQANILRYTTAMTEENIKQINADGSASNMDTEIDRLLNFIKSVQKGDRSL